jgi:hypothetical protein
VGEGFGGVFGFEELGAVAAGPAGAVFAEGDVFIVPDGFDGWEGEVASFGWGSRNQMLSSRD